MPVLRKQTKSALKATTLTKILEVEGRGALRGIRCADPDNLSQNERLQITIDGDIIFNKTDYDIPQAAEILDLVQTFLKGDTTATTDAKLISDQRVPFHKSLKIEYLRAAAGTTGLTIDLLIELKSWF